MKLNKKRKSASDISSPLYEIVNGEIISTKGEKSYLYKLVVPDQDQLQGAQVQDFYNQIAAKMRNLSIKDWLKFYKIGRKVYLNTNITSLDYFDLKGELVENPIEEIYGPLFDINDINFYEGYLTLGNEFWRIIHVDSLATSLNETYFDQFGEDYLVTVKKVADEASKKLLARNRRSQSLALEGEHRNHQGEAAYDSADELLEAICVGGDSLFKIGAWFFVKGEHYDDVNKRAIELYRALKNLGAKCYLEEIGLDYYFAKAIVGVPPTAKKNFQLNSLNASLLLPLSSSHLHEDGLLLYDYNWNEIYYDFLLESYSNLNTVITGQSGEGKSFFLGNLAHYLYNNRGVNLGIFDLGGSIKRVALYNGGVNLSHKFNPFQFRDDKYLLNFFIAAIGENLSRMERGKIHNSIKTNLEKDVDNFRDFVELVNIDCPDIKFYFSELWEYFCDDYIDPPKIFYVDVKGLPEVIIAPYFVFAKELSESRDGIIIDIFDECWNFIEKCPDILTAKVRTGRKELRANIFVIQEMDSFSTQYKDVSSAILGNTYTKIYFNQPSLEHPMFTDFDISTIKNDVKSKKGDYSCLYICNPEYRKVCYFRATPFIYQLCHSEKKERLVQESYIEEKHKFLTYKESFERWMEFKYA